MTLLGQPGVESLVLGDPPQVSGQHVTHAVALFGQLSGPPCRAFEKSPEGAYQQVLASGEMQKDGAVRHARLPGDIKGARREQAIAGEH